MKSVNLRAFWFFIFMSVVGSGLGLSVAYADPEVLTFQGQGTYRAEGTGRSQYNFSVVVRRDAYLHVDLTYTHEGFYMAKSFILNPRPQDPHFFDVSSPDGHIQGHATRMDNFIMLNLTDNGQPVQLNWYMDDANQRFSENGHSGPSERANWSGLASRQN